MAPQRPAWRQLLDFCNSISSYVLELFAMYVCLRHASMQGSAFDYIAFHRHILCKACAGKSMPTHIQRKQNGDEDDSDDSEASSDDRKGFEPAGDRVLEAPSEAEPSQDHRAPSPAFSGEARDPGQLWQPTSDQ